MTTSQRARGGVGFNQPSTGVTPPKPEDSAQVEARSALLKAITTRAPLAADGGTGEDVKALSEAYAAVISVDHMLDH